MSGVEWRKTHGMHCIHASSALSDASRYQAAISASVSGRVWVTPVSAAGGRLQHRHHRQRLRSGNRIAAGAAQGVAYLEVILALIAIRRRQRAHRLRADKQAHRVVVFAPLRRARRHAGQQLALLPVGARLTTLPFSPCTVKRATPPATSMLPCRITRCVG